MCLALIQKDSGLLQGLAGRPAAGWKCGKPTGRSAALSAEGRKSPMLDMKRRAFITLLGGAAAAWPLAARAQQRSKISRIGYLDPLSRSNRMAAGWVEAFRSGLHDLGYVEGKNIIIEYRWSEGTYDRLGALTAELVHLGIDVLVTYGTPATRAAKQATTSVPIVMAISGDAIATGLIISLNRPGGNITGSTFFNPELCAKRLELIKEAVPPTIRVGVLLNPDNPIHLPCLQEMERTAKSINLELEPFQVRSPNEFESAFLAWDTKHVNAMTVIEDAMLIANSKAIVELATKRRLPSIAFKEIAEGGGLMAYGVDFAKPFYRAAYFMDKILNGANPNDLPVEQATKFDLVVNLQAAKMLGLDLPPTLLARADEVIE
jgi:putative ABC transport system substrate-binding protein